MKKVLISDVIIISQKRYNLVQARMMYELYYCYKINKCFRRNSRTVRLDLIEAKEIARMNNESNEKVIEKIFSGEVLQREITLLTKEYKEMVSISVFDSIKYELVEKRFEFVFNEGFVRIANELDEGFSEIILSDYRRLKSKYSQRMYELYVKFKNQRAYNMPIEHFKRFFNVPKSYDIKKIEERIIEAPAREIEDIMNKEVVRVKKRKRSGKVTHFEFAFR